MSDDKLDLIRKLLAKAESTTNELEREAFNRKAADLIAKFSIDEALLANAGKTREEVGDRIITLQAPYLLDKATLLHNVGVPLRVQAVRRSNTHTSESVEMHLFGFSADLERVDILFTSLLVQASYGLATVRPGGYHYGSQSVAAYRRSWLAGFTSAVRARLDAAEERARANADADRQDGQPGTALVLATRQEQVEARKLQRYPDFIKGKPRRLQGNGYRNGREAGERADLGGSRLGAKGAGRIGQ